MLICLQTRPTDRDSSALIAELAIGFTDKGSNRDVGFECLQAGSKIKHPAVPAARVSCLMSTLKSKQYADLEVECSRARSIKRTRSPT
jgi:hypothetical protein